MLGEAANLYAVAKKYSFKACCSDRGPLGQETFFGFSVNRSINCLHITTKMQKETAKLQKHATRKQLESCRPLRPSKDLPLLPQSDLRVWAGVCGASRLSNQTIVGANCCCHYFFAHVM